MEPQVVDGLWCLPAGPIPDKLGKRDEGELVFLPDSVEFRGPDGTLTMSPIRGFSSGSVQRPFEQQPREAAVIDYGEEGRRVFLVSRSDFNPRPKMVKIFNALKQGGYFPQSRVTVYPFKEDFLDPGIIATMQVGSLTEMSITFPDTCFGCGRPDAPPVRVPFFLRIEIPAGHYKEIESGWLPAAFPVCLPCHGFGLFNLLAIEAQWWFDLGSRLLLQLPSIVAYEPFRVSNDIPKDVFLAKPGLAHAKKAMDEASADAALAPARDAWAGMEERFGLHRYLRIKGRLRRLSEKKGVRRKPLLSSEEIRAGLSELMGEEGLSPEDLREVERLMNEKVPALAELG